MTPEQADQIMKHLGIDSLRFYKEGPRQGKAFVILSGDVTEEECCWLMELIGKEVTQRPRHATPE